MAAYHPTRRQVLAATPAVLYGLAQALGLAGCKGETPQPPKQEPPKPKTISEIVKETPADELHKSYSSFFVKYGDEIAKEFGAVAAKSGYKNASEVPASEYQGLMQRLVRRFAAEDENAKRVLELMEHRYEKKREGIGELADANIPFRNVRLVKEKLYPKEPVKTYLDPEMLFLEGSLFDSVKPIEVTQVYTTRSGLEAAKVGRFWIPFNSLTAKPGEYYKGIARKEIASLERYMRYSEQTISELDQAMSAKDTDKLRELLKFEPQVPADIFTPKKSDDLVKFVQWIKERRTRGIAKAKGEIQNLRGLLN